jgi:RNA ligase (TIGR02306 family)
MNRKLVTIRTVSEIKPIANADMIEMAIVDGWQLVTKKNEFKVGDRAVYLEIDSFLPIKPEFEFLRRSSYKKMGDEEGFRLKTIRLRGETSQGLLLPLSILNLTGDENDDDLASLLGVKLYEPPVPAQLAGQVVGMFPSFIQKTDQERVQNLTGKLWGKGNVITYTDGDGNEITKVIPPAPKRKYEVSEKADGSSCTIFNYGDKFGVCSRNLQLEEDPENSFWKMAIKYNLKEKLSGHNVAIQGELCGEGIQKNKYRLKGQDLFVFDIYDIETRRYFNPEERSSFLSKVAPELKSVPILERDFELPDDIGALLAYAQGVSKINPQQEREGLVFKEEECSLDRFSFKAISNKFLLAEKD